MFGSFTNCFSVVVYNRLTFIVALCFITVPVKIAGVCSDRLEQMWAWHLRLIRAWPI